MKVILSAALVVVFAVTGAALWSARAGQLGQARMPSRRPPVLLRAPDEPAAVSSPSAPPREPSTVAVVEPAPEPIAIAAPEASAPPALVPGGPPAASEALPGGWGSAALPELDPRPFSEAHWQGLEMIPKTATLAEALGLPADAKGVIVDDVGLPADLQGFRAGDLVTAIGGVPTPDLLSVVRAADRVREQREIELEIVRKGATERLVLRALFEHLGTANGETPTMIPPGARSPHPYQGACTKCHRIGSTGSLATDQGDTPVGSPPPIRAGSTPPHRDRGPCAACHQIST